MFLISKISLLLSLIINIFVFLYTLVAILFKGIFYLIYPPIKFLFNIIKKSFLFLIIFIFSLLLKTMHFGLNSIMLANYIIWSFITSIFKTIKLIFLAPLYLFLTLYQWLNICFINIKIIIKYIFYKTSNNYKEFNFKQEKQKQILNIKQRIVTSKTFIKVGCPSKIKQLLNKLKFQIKKNKVYTNITKGIFISIIFSKNIILVIARILKWLINFFINLYKFVVNVFIILFIIIKSLGINFIQLFKKKTWIDLKGNLITNIPIILQNIKHISAILLRELYIVIKLIYKFFKYLIIFLIMEIGYKIINKIKNSMLKSFAFIVIFGIFLWQSIFFYLNSNLYFEQTEKWQNHFGVTKTSELITNIIKSELLLPNRYYKIKISIENGDNLYNLLLKENVDPVSLKDLISKINEKYKINTIKPGWVIDVIIASSSTFTNNRVQKISIPVDNFYNLVAEADTNYKYSVYKQEKKLTRYILKRKIIIKNSLYQSALDAGIPANIVSEYFKILSWDVDFQREIRERDTIEMVYECLYDMNDDLATCDNLIYGSLKGSAKTSSFYKYNNAYYHENGDSAAKTLLKTPTNNARLSSSFGKREHPVLGYTVFHKGIDFAAPVGTPIYASGDGIVTISQYSATYGNYVKIKHNPYLETLYAHMVYIAKGITVGTRVTQGQTIGYVGATGRVTGPHLHYEVMVNNKQVNPLIIKTPSNAKLSGQELIKFTTQKDNLDSLLIRMPSTGKILSPNYGSEDSGIIKQ
jgi:murein DD-endopeptidase MepM/ murein hydrolase activator NlpD